MERKGSFVESKIEKKLYPLAPSEYKLLEEIGRGVSAVVYRAKCLPFGEDVAIKTLDLERCNSSLDDIRREAQTLSLIKHPNVVKAYCSFVVDQSLWVVMPYMAGGSCLHIMKAAYPDGFEEATIATFLKETLKALEYLHHHGHIHRDVKAGNILVDNNGMVKLGDFGVSACMFDTGDRQRSRLTFVGTPCWMAPEVMEQLHGYDFKADIWSFGITALELAHGHAPFSKYPPMKVLLMTLQNAPPGLDYERDRRFSKSFKEMIAMCLVKDPSKRPTAEKLLKHSFFKHARSPDYLARSIVGHLPPLWERVHDLKMKDAVRLAQKKMPYGEQEERSLNEYKRGVSSWNFDVEDLKTQAALIQDDAGHIPCKEEIHAKGSERKDSDNLDLYCSSSPPSSVNQDVDSTQQSGTIHSLKAPAVDAGERFPRARSGPLPASVLTKSLNGSKSAHLHTGKKEPKHIGRFDVFEDDPDQESTASPGDSRTLQQHKAEEKEHGVRDGENTQSRMDKDGVMRDEKEPRIELKQAEDRVHEQEHSHRTSVAECTDDVREGDRDNPPTERTSVDNGPLPPLLKQKSLSGPLPASSIPLESRSFNGATGSSRPTVGQKDSSEEKLKGPLVQKKGRFSVTSHDMELQEGVSSPNARKNASVQTSSIHKSASVGDWLPERRNPAPTPTPSQVSSISSNVFGGMNASAVVTQLQNLFNQTTVQQDTIVSLMNAVNPSEQPSAYRSSGLGSRSFPRSTTTGSLDSMGELSTERERELLAQVAELQCRVTTLADELQAVKLRNVQLERQLNTIFNKEEEERIRREEAARDDGGVG